MTLIEKKTIPAFGYEILRDYVMPSILGKHEHNILYWAGKELARKFPCGDLQLIIAFFEDAGWGTLLLEKESKDSYLFHLTNATELMNVQQRTFSLEAGFIAEQIQSMKGCLTECYDEKKERQQLVLFQVKWDSKETINL